MTRPRILVVVDTPTWAWQRKAEAYQRHLGQRFAISLAYHQAGVDVRGQRDLPAADAVTRTHLNNLLDAIDAIEAPDPTDIQLFYDEFKLPLALRVALNGFHQTWRAILGLETQPNIPKEHWARIKALSRYIGYLAIAVPASATLVSSATTT